MNLSSAWVTRLECPKGVKDEVKQARRAKRVAEGHQLEIGAQRAPRFLVYYISLVPGFGIQISITKRSSGWMTKVYQQVSEALDREVYGKMVIFLTL